MASARAALMRPMTRMRRRKHKIAVRRRLWDSRRAAGRAALPSVPPSWDRVPGVTGALTRPRESARPLPAVALPFSEPRRRQRLNAGPWRTAIMSGSAPSLGAVRALAVDRDLVEAAQRGDREAYVDLIRAAQRPALRDRPPHPPRRRSGRGRPAGRAGDRLARPAEAPRSGPVRRLAAPGPRQHLHRPGDARAPSGRNLRVLPVDGPAAPDDLSTWPTGTSSNAGFAAAARPAGDPRPAPLPRVRPSEIAETLGIPAGHGPLPTPPCPSRHAGRPRGGRSSRVDRRPFGMTRQRDLDRLLDIWLADGPTEAADAVLDVVADRIDRQPQRPAWRLSWRTPS